MKLKIRKTIFLRFIFGFISVGVIPITILSFISLSIYKDYLEKQTSNKIDQMITYTAKNVESVYGDINNISQLMYKYRTGESVFRDDIPIYFDENLSVEERMDELLLAILYSDQQITSVFFVPNDTDNVVYLSKSNEKFLKPNYVYPPEEWRNEVNDNKRSLVVFPSHEESYFGKSDHDQQVITFARSLLDTSHSLKYERIGTLYMDVSLSVFDNIFTQLKLGEDDIVSIRDDRNDTIIYSNKNLYTGIQDENNTLESKHYIYTEKKIEGTNWVVSANISQDNLDRQSDRMQQTIILFTLFCLVALIIGSILYSRHLAKPIIKITQRMKEIESGNFNVGVQVNTNDEIGMLANGFNSMATKLHTYIQEVYVTTLKQKQSELNALKSQIRPHYLYNTLEVIRMSAVSNDDDKVADMIHALSKQLKYVINYGEDTVVLKEELENTLNYFQLVSAGYEDRIHLYIDIQESFMNFNVPKLSIQPMVENAFHHGLKPNGGKGNITIRAYIENDFVYVRVEDDGVGMESTKLAHVQMRLIDKFNAEETEGVGLTNINERIKTIYGEKYGLRIHSEVTLGTIVQMKLPVAKEETK
ncbi:sensor histidine kinase [Rossellomorea marisflavi]|uniref:cache domain-containing sensor histidine kinase n=1 Tax=Rossellomorea marisflavi TaxID=189381 RepID=UPI0035168D12